MSRTVNTLLVLFLAQLLLCAIVFWPRSEQGDGPETRLAPWDPDTINEIYISDEQDRETVLLRRGDLWVLPELGELPADPQRVTGLIDGLFPTQPLWPVADTTAARQRLQVAAYHYQRRLTLVADGELLGTIYLGTSPGFRRVHARMDQDDNIFSIALSNFDVPGDDGAWLDRALLQVRAPMQITADGYTVLRQDDGWLRGDGTEVDSREVEALVIALRNLQVEGLASEDMQRDLAQAEADLVLDIDSLAGTVTLELFHSGGQHYILSSEYPWFFRLGAHQFDRISAIDAALMAN